MDQSTPSWKMLKLSLERPYKDDEGNPIQTLYDITPDGEQIYEPPELPSKKLGNNIRRILLSRSIDFFEGIKGLDIRDENLEVPGSVPETSKIDPAKGQGGEKETGKQQHMTVDELYKLRMEVMPRLFIALGEMTQARELLSSLLSGSPNPSTDVPTPLASTIVNRSTPIPSVQAFNAQLSIGGKDEALRRAADVFKGGADSMERGRQRSERYWVDALRIRRGNWGLVPAPLPLGAPMGKGADKTSKDFLIAYSLEESPLPIRQQSVAYLGTDSDSDALIFPHRKYTRLRVSISATSASGLRNQERDSSSSDGDGTLNDLLFAAQREAVEREIFSVLVSEAGNLPSASARVSERLIVIDAAQGTELKFELVEDHIVGGPAKVDTSLSARCDLIRSLLHVLLSRRHDHLKSQRLGRTGIFRHPAVPEQSKSVPPPILQPIIDVLQYEVFLQRIGTELQKVNKALKDIGIATTLRLEAVDEIGQQLILLATQADYSKRIGGEAVLRMDGRHTIRFSFVAPSTLTAHLAQATLTVSSIPQLSQLLADEVEAFLLNRICEVGRRFAVGLGGVWFVDVNRCVGRWEGNALTLKMIPDTDSKIVCKSFHLHKGSPRDGTTNIYAGHGVLPILKWAEGVITRAVSQS